MPQIALTWTPLFVRYCGSSAYPHQIPADMWIGVDERRHAGFLGQLGELGGMRLRIENDDTVGVRPFINADLGVELVAKDLRGLLTTVQDDVQPAGCPSAQLAVFRHTEAPRVRQAVRSRGPAGNEFSLIESDDPARGRRGGWPEVRSVDRRELRARLVVAAIVDVGRLVDGAFAAERSRAGSWQGPLMTGALPFSVLDRAA